eukprot:TRINITY_DN112133_c0_g1_i1.p1 TRINITY_DN112133_c0_g1~~TRINITY_DN112133_c0_g1_i1.p1  ORF type:complete len:409 (+),score=126.75 TRINITY_DN112133_c0_g1_i1:124-1350(+)
MADGAGTSNKQDDRLDEDDAESEAEEEDPKVTELKDLDDKCLALQLELDREVQELRRKFASRQALLLEKRRTLLSDRSGCSGDAANAGTPACAGFWLRSLKHMPTFDGAIEAWDQPVLECLSDIRSSLLEEDTPSKGFRVELQFSENPWFTDEVLWKEYHFGEASAVRSREGLEEIRASEIHWLPGQNVTTEVVKKKTKGGGAKKKNKTTEEPRDSFFRGFFKNLAHGKPIPEDINLELYDKEDDESLMDMLLENELAIGNSIRKMLVPWAVRWYTGEAAGAEETDEEDDEEAVDPAAGRCPEGHPLHRLVLEVQGGGCDLCEKDVPKGDVLWGCRFCNWDACDVCHEKKADYYEPDESDSEGGDEDSPSCSAGKPKSKKKAGPASESVAQKGKGKGGAMKKEDCKQQ